MYLPARNEKKSASGEIWGPNPHPLKSGLAAERSWSKSPVSGTSVNGAERRVGNFAAPLTCSALCVFSISCCLDDS